MDSKRLILAVAISMLVFIGWNALSVKMGWVPEAPIAQQATQNVTPTTSAPSIASVESQLPPNIEASAFEAAKGSDIVVETPLYRAVFNSQGGVLREFSLKKYDDRVLSNSPVFLISPKIAYKTPMGLMLAGMNTATQAEWSFAGENLALQNDETGTLKFMSSFEGLQVVREFTFSAGTYVISEKLHVQSDRERELKLAFIMAAEPLVADAPPSVFATLKYALFGGEKPEIGESQYNKSRIAWLQDNSFDQETSLSDLAKGERIMGNVSWGAVLNNYFVCAVSMPAEQGTALFNRYDTGIFQTSIGKPEVVVGAGSHNTFEASYYLGPKSSDTLAGTPNNLSRVLDYGFFSIIATPLVAFLKFLYNYVGNYGIAIVLMTIVIKIVFWPLSQKSYKSMEEMKRIQPEVARIREKYADDKETMNKEIMQLYRSHKVNPAGGCVPILVQIPVFFGLYQGLLNSIELRHTAFITNLPFTDLPWLIDLSAPDPYCITPLIMGATMFLQQKMAPPMGDPMQAKIMLFMPIIFTFIFLNFPSGLVVYWLVNNIISIAQQRMQRKSGKKLDVSAA